MTIKTLTMLTTVATVGIGLIAVPPNAAARVLPYERRQVPPETIVYNAGNRVAQTSKAQRTDGALRPTDEVVLYVHEDLKRKDFIQPLICALRRVLVAPVDVADIDLPLGSDLMSTPTQFDVGAVASRFIGATEAEGGAQTFKYLLHPYDMKEWRFRFVFAASSYGNAPPPYHVGIVSMARLDVNDASRTRAEVAQISAGRAYKLILKSVAQLAGLTDTGGCILAFSRTLEELDGTSAEFCPADREALVAAKVLKPEESGGCMYVSERR
jgi:predicted Zn-dependent protease